MDTSRRGILRLMAGAAATATVAPQQAAKALGIEGGLVAGGTGNVMSEVCLGPPSVNRSAVGKLRSALWAKSEAESVAMHNQLPPHIANKKSWSPAFKASIHTQETLMMRAFMERLDGDEAEVSKLLSILGIPTD